MNVVSTSVTAGEQFWVEISIENDNEFVGFQCDLDYPASFTYLDAVLSERENGHQLSKNDDGDAVRLIGVDLSTNNAFEGNSGTVVSVKFQASNTPDEYTFSLVNDIIISNSSGTNILTGYTNGTVTVTEVPLPITLTSFHAQQTNKGVRLMWTTASEIENSCFCLYRDDELIGTVEGAGTSSEPHDYSFIDRTAQAGTHRYVLSDINYGGEETIHHSQSVEIDVDNIDESVNTFKLLDAYPNPFNPNAIIGYEIPEETQVMIDLYDIEGKMVKSLMNEQVPTGYHTLKIDGHDLQSGVYIISMKADDHYACKKLILMK
jgi:hypothetical protein